MILEEEKSFYIKLKKDQIPKHFLMNANDYGIQVDEFCFSEVDYKNSILIAPDEKNNPLENQSTVVAISTAIAQSLAGSVYSGGLNQLLGRKTLEINQSFGNEIDAATVKVGKLSFEKLAKELDIEIIIGGNEGSFRDESVDLPVGLVINHGGGSGRYIYFGDSIEVTNGVKNSVGYPGSSSMVSLVPEFLMPSTDGYKISIAIDIFNSDKAFPKIDPIITKQNTLYKVLQQIAHYQGVENDKIDHYIKNLHNEYDFVTLDRAKHDDMIFQAKELGFDIQTREDGDPALFIRAMLGIKGENGKKIFVISTGGANEHMMSMIFAKLFNKAFSASTFASTKSLKQVDKDFKDNRGQGGSLDLAREYHEHDLQNFYEINKEWKLLADKLKNFNSHLLPETLDDLSDHILTPDSVKLESINRDSLTTFVMSSVTGANKLDWGILHKHIKPVTWIENQDGSGRIIVSGFFINNDGKINFFRSSLSTKNVTKSRYSIISQNDLLPNPFITKYDKTRAIFEKMLIDEAFDHYTAKEHVENINNLLEREIDAYELLKELNLIGLSENNKKELINVLKNIEKYIIGKPVVKMEDGDLHFVVR